MLRLMVPVCFITAILVGCADRSFEAARSEDAAAAYYRFLRDHPRSRYADEAEQRLALAGLRNTPSVDGYAAFVKRWPTSPLLPEVHAIMEVPAFERARARGDAEAYRAFLAEFPDGTNAARARGNLGYLESRGFGGRVEALSAFAREHSESDFAPEAARTVASVDARSRTAFRKVRLAIDLSGSTPERERLARVFAQRSAESLGDVGVSVVPDGDYADRSAVRLSIRHHEGEVEAHVDEHGVATRGFHAETALELSAADGTPIWKRTTRFKPPAPPARSDRSLILSAGAQRYWSSFFVPVASWSTRAAVRVQHALHGEGVAVETRGARAFVLVSDGSFRVVDLADPERPWTLAEHRHARDLKQFDGIRVLGSRVVIFGPDGAEIVALGADGTRTLRVFERGEVGTVAAVEPIDGELLAAGRRGLRVLPEEEGVASELLVDREVVGIVSVGEHFVFSDGRSVYVSSLPLLRENRIVSQLDLAPGMQATALRRAGTGIVLISELGALWIDVSDPAAPRVVARIDASRAGALSDATVVGGRLFVLGQRGLQLVDPRAGRSVESADVVARARVAPMGRHLVLVGEGGYQVVDTTPFLTSESAAFDPAAGGAFVAEPAAAGGAFIAEPAAAGGAFVAEPAAAGGSFVAEPAGRDAVPDDEDLGASPVKR